MRRLLIVTAVIEVGAGAALMAAPSWVASLLVGVPLPSIATESVARVAAAALLALGVACGGACGDADSRAATGVISGMLIYNVGTAVVLAWTGLHVQPVGVALWPAVMLHAGLGVWCAAGLMTSASRSVAGHRG
jgi:hypothetical protein